MSYYAEQDAKSRAVAIQLMLLKAWVLTKGQDDRSKATNVKTVEPALEEEEEDMVRNDPGAFEDTDMFYAGPDDENVSGVF